ncbi:MAG: hypothetical protein Q7S20_08055 [Gemmatimonadaceae bacterium]|nr:hypothetical protein [Gemmatimonadaceae bacterium]
MRKVAVAVAQGLICVVGGIAALAATAIGQTATPKPLSVLSCGAGQRIVIAASPVKSPNAAGVYKHSGSSGVSGPGLVGIIIRLVDPPRFDDVTPEFKTAIGAVLDPVDLRQLLLARAEQVIKPRTSCETVFLPVTWEGEEPAAFRPSDRVVAISLSFLFIGERPAITALLAVSVTTGENIAETDKRAPEIRKIVEEINQLKPYFPVYNKQPDVAKLTQLAALTQKIVAIVMPYVDQSGTVNYKSRGHSTKEWLANRGALTTQEIAAAMDRLMDDLAGILFK